MFRFLGLSLALFVAFAAAWAWFTGDTRSFQMAYWKSVISGMGQNAANVTGANVGGSTTRSPAAPPATPSPTEAVRLTYSTVSSPAGRYVTAKMADAAPVGSSSSSDAAGSYTVISSPGGRYVDAPAMAAPAEPMPKYTVISSPGGRYVEAPKIKVAAAAPKYTIVSSPPGRYVKAPKVKVVKRTPTPKYTVISSPAGRYVTGPAVERPAAKPTKYTVVSSPAGRYVTGPAVKRGPSRYTVVSSPDGRYVSGPGSVPVDSVRDAIVFPINFEYRTSEFTKEGRKAADRLLAYVLKKKYSDITLAGHTDSRGSQKVNLKVSAERLEAVAKHLRDNGYTGGISLIPKGKNEPNTSIDRSRYTQEQLYDLDRRVELVSGG